MLVIIRDETTGRDLSLNLSPEQLERAQQDSAYVAELIKDYDAQINSVDSLPQTVQPIEENNVSSHSEQDASSLFISCEDNEMNDNNAQSSSLFIWSDACILLLLNLYEEKKEDFSNKRHIKIYNEIAKQMHSTNPKYLMTGNQCQSKINSLKKTYKKILDHNSTSGNDRVTWPYFDRMNDIFGQSGWANPVATASEAGPSETIQANQRENLSKKRKIDTFNNYFEAKKKIMVERLAVKKESIKIKQEQHKEKMDMLRTFCNLLNNK